MRGTHYPAREYIAWIKQLGTLPGLEWTGKQLFESLLILRNNCLTSWPCEQQRVPVTFLEAEEFRG